MGHGKLMMFAAAVSLAACSDSTGTNEVHRVDVAIQQTDAMLLAAPILQTATAAQGKISVSQVDSLFITITSIAFLPVLADGDTTEASWETIALTDPLAIDLLALPAEDDSALVIAEGTLPEGDYERMRFLISASSIYFNASTTVGNATFDPDAEYDVKVPSGSSSGLKTDIGFTVAADTAVNVLFSTTATFEDVTATGSGMVILSPVLKSRGNPQ